MRKSGNRLPPNLKGEVASGIGALSSAANPQHIKQQDQLAPSDQSEGRGSTSVASKPRPRRKRARRNYQYPARLVDGAARHNKWKRANAQKSGVFAEPLILPGEDRREFEGLHAALIEEWNPSGPSEESKVFGIADAEWRKLRSRRFAEARAISNSMRSDHPAFDETRGMITFGYLFCRKPTAFTEYARNLLRADRIEYLNQKFPRQNFESTVDWTAAIAEEIKSVLLPATPGFAALDPDSLDPATEARRIEVIRMQSFLTTIHMGEFLEHDLDQEERLDVRIAKLIKELFEIKTKKQMLRQTSEDNKE